VARCAFRLGASTVTGGNSVDRVAGCALAGELAAKRAPSASTLAELKNKFDREKEMARRAAPCALQFMSCPTRSDCAGDCLSLRATLALWSAYLPGMCASSEWVFELLKVRAIQNWSDSRGAIPQCDCACLNCSVDEMRKVRRASHWLLQGVQQA
jgi:hypothetical protein